MGKRSRAETGIGRGAVSVSSAAVALAAERLGSLVERRVLVLGAGEMGEGMARSLAGSGVAEVVVAGRGTERASELIARVGGGRSRSSGSRRPSPPPTWCSPRPAP